MSGILQDLDKCLEMLRKSPGLLQGLRRDYIVPGLSSYLLSGGQGREGPKVRLFHQERPFEGWITPHDHRFDLACYVLKGEVKHTVYSRSYDPWSGALYSVQRFPFSLDGRMEPDETAMFTSATEVYGRGNFYHLGYTTFHTVKFSRGAMVLFFEGPDLQEHNHVLLPVSNGRIINTATVQPWMQREQREGGLDG